MYYILAILFMALSLGVLTLIDRKIKANTTTVMKVLSIVLVVLFFVWYLIPGRFISPTTNLEEIFSGNVLRNYTRTEGPLPEKLKVLFKDETNIEIRSLKDVYPMGWERTLVKQITGKEYERLPAECGVIVNDSALEEYRNIFSSDCNC